MKPSYTAVIKCDTERWNSMEKMFLNIKYSTYLVGKTPTRFFLLSCFVFLLLFFFVSHFKSRFFVVANKHVQLIAIMSIFDWYKIWIFKATTDQQECDIKFPSDFQMDIKVLSPFLLSWEFINFSNCNLISTQFSLFTFQPIILIGVSILTI